MAGARHVGADPGDSVRTLACQDRPGDTRLPVSRDRVPAQESLRLFPARRRKRGKARLRPD